MDGVTPADAGLLAVRLVLGGIYLAHGARKLGLGQPEGFAGFRGSVARRGFRPAGPWAVASVGAELVGALLVASGLLGGLGPALLFAQSLTIVILVWPRGFWHDHGGIEYPLLLAAASIALACTGPGAASLDAMLGITLPSLAGPTFAGLAAVGAVGGLVSRRPAA
jgi:putative oxidoreductase